MVVSCFFSGAGGKLLGDLKFWVLQGRAPLQPGSKGRTHWQLGWGMRSLSGRLYLGSRAEHVLLGVALIPCGSGAVMGKP